jgi:hypothetical protein
MTTPMHAPPLDENHVDVMMFISFLSVSIGCDAVIASDSPRLSGLAAEISEARERRVHGVSTMNRVYSLVCFASIASCT